MILVETLGRDSVETGPGEVGVDVRGYTTLTALCLQGDVSKGLVCSLPLEWCGFHST